MAPNRGYSRMQQLWLTERICDLVAHELGLDPVEVRKKNYVRTDEMPYKTPNGCVYDSGDYARCLDIALELIDYEPAASASETAERNRTGSSSGSASARRSTRARTTSASRRCSTRSSSSPGTTRWRRSSSTSSARSSSRSAPSPRGRATRRSRRRSPRDILGVSPDQIHVRPGHDSYWNSHAGFSGTYASQFAVTGLEAVKGAAEKLALEIRRLAGGVLGGADPDDIVLEGGFAKRKDNPEAALPFMACGAIINANNAAIPPELRDITLNCRYVYVPPFELPDLERKFGNLTLTYATQIHACVVEIDPETGEVEIADYAAVDDCGIRIHPQIVEGQVHGATAHAIGAALHETFAYDEYGQLLTANFYDYHVPHALDMPEIKTGYIESPSPFSSLGTKGMGEGGGAAIHAICAAIQDALRSAGIAGGRQRLLQPARAGLAHAPDPGGDGGSRGGNHSVKVEGLKEFDAPAQLVWDVLKDPSKMAKLLPGVESFEIQDDRHW